MSIVVNQKVASFQPVTLTITDPSTLADLIGALGAYGKGKTKAKKTIREAGLLDSYSGNARKTARTIVAALAEKVGFDVPDFGYGVTGSINEELIEDDMEEVA
jgi:ABC-type uncharacterized transport system ATPase subunit